MRSSTRTTGPPPHSSRSPPGSHRQRAGEIAQPLPGAEPRTGRPRRAVAAARPAPGRTSRSAAAPRGREGDPPRRVVPACAHRPGRGRHGHEQHRPPRAYGPPASPGPHRVSRSPARTAPASATPSGAVRASTPRSLCASRAAPYLVRVPGGRVHHRQPRRFRHRPRPARCGAAQRRTAPGAQHRAAPAAASALGRQHQVGEVPPPFPQTPHGHHCARARGPDQACGKRWRAPCGKLRALLATRSPHE